MTKHEVLKKVFGHSSFREGQEEIVDSILAGRDVLGIMPTGAGKSVCYQVPALMLPGITVVVSPLISLMIDQVKELNEAGIHAAYINSSLTENQITKALQNAIRGQYKIVYVAPERLETNRFLEFVMNADISMITVDEAHCISQWGQDFRPSYLKIVNLINRFEKRPIVSAFTATATSEVKDDIMCILGLVNPLVKITGFDRENLYFEVRKTANKDGEILNYVKSHSTESGIIYCSTRKNVDKVYLMLAREGIPVTKYHAGLDNDVRKQNQEDFIYDRKPVVVATNAFGMGINKLNVRYVLHYNMPQSMENYYQEAGRAGRDGLDSECILFYSGQDVAINEFLINNKGENSELSEEELETVKENDMQRLLKMRFYCATKDCLREYMLNYFGDSQGKKECDNCCNCNADFRLRDVTDIARTLVEGVKQLKERFGINVLVGMLRGSNTAKLRSYNMSSYSLFGKLKMESESFIKSVVEELLMNGYLRETEDMYRLIKLTDESDTVFNDDFSMQIKWSDLKEAHKETKVKHSKARKSDVLNSKGLELFEKLRALRLEIAKEENMPPYIVFNDKTLVDMCMKLPFTKDEMLSVNGVGENKYDRYGVRFIQEIIDFTDANKISTHY